MTKGRLGRSPSTTNRRLTNDDTADAWLSWEGDRCRVTSAWSRPRLPLTHAESLKPHNRNFQSLPLPSPARLLQSPRSMKPRHFTPCSPSVSSATAPCPRAPAVSPSSSFWCFGCL